MHNYKFHSIKDEQLDHFTDPAYADDAAILMSDQFQADTGFQSMSLLL